MFWFEKVFWKFEYLLLRGQQQRFYSLKYWIREQITNKFIYDANKWEIDQQTKNECETSLDPKIKNWNKQI